MVSHIPKWVIHVLGQWWGWQEDVGFRSFLRKYRSLWKLESRGRGITDGLRFVRLVLSLEGKGRRLT